MVYNRQRIIFWVRMVFILATLWCLISWIPKTNMNMASVLVAGVLLIQIFALQHHIEKPQRDINRFFDAIRYSDFTQTFSDNKTDKSLEPMKEAFSKVMEAFRNTRAEKELHYRYLQTVVQHLGVGLLVFKSDGQVDLANQAVKKLFGLPSIKNIKRLAQIQASIPDILKSTKPGEKSHIQFYHSESGNSLTLSIYTTQFIIGNENFTLASIQNIQTELEEKELDAWQNLIRVLTHEIMNSITPIASLAATAKAILEKSSRETNPDAIDDVNQAIQTIETRSHGLLKFVQSYRQLTRLPKPDFKIVSIQELFQLISKLMEPRLKERGVTFEHSVSPVSLEITADKNLIEQVLINLLQNASDWCSRKNNTHVKLNAQMGAGGRPVIQVIDNGPGIQKEALEKIFIPFFTTKEDGSGIGLSLSRQIMRLHHGNIFVQSTPEVETVFTLRF